MTNAVVETAEAISTDASHCADEQSSLAPTPPIAASLSGFLGGEWLNPGALHAQMLDALGPGDSVTVDVSGANYLPGSVLQVFLALQHGTDDTASSRLILQGVSDQLSSWFDYAGATSLCATGRVG